MHCFGSSGDCEAMIHRGFSGRLPAAVRFRLPLDRASAAHADDVDFWLRFDLAGAALPGGHRAGHDICIALAWPGGVNTVMRLLYEAKSGAEFTTLIVATSFKPPLTCIMCSTKAGSDPCYMRTACFTS